MRGTWARLAALPLDVSGYRLERRARAVSRDFTRVTTLVILEGGGLRGVGEDVTYTEPDQRRFVADGPRLDLTGARSLADLSRRLDEQDAFTVPPTHAASRNYRRWAFESAALDLALRQAGISLPRALGLVPAPIRFVWSTGLGRPPRLEAVARRRADDPGLELKLDADPSWTEDACRRIAALGGVRVVDFKGAYRGTPVDQPPDAALYRRVARHFPDAWLEDPALCDETRTALAGAEDRVTWDAPLHCLRDLLEYEPPPRCINVKPSRFGRIEELMRVYDHCRKHGIAMYGGGQFELDAGRGQIQQLASLFHPEGPNDVAPTGYNRSDPDPGPARSPLDPAPLAVGFGREGDAG